MKIRNAVMPDQIDLVKTQMQPHFLFNTLNTLIGLIEIDTKRAIAFTQNLSDIYRYHLEANEYLLISLSEEIRILNSYLELFHLRYAEGLEVALEVEDASGYQVPPFSLQLLAENAIKHNRFSRENPLELLIYFDKKEQRMIVQNNIQPKRHAQTTGKGLRSLQTQCEYLNLGQIAVTRTSEYFIVDFPVKKTFSDERNYC